MPRSSNSQDCNGAINLSKLTCRFCDAILQTRYQLRQHENEHMGLNAPPAKSPPNEIVNKPSSLLETMLPDLRFFKCVECDKPYSRRDSLQKHFRTKHPGKQLLLYDNGEAHVGGDKSLGCKRTRPSPPSDISKCKQFIISIDNGQISNVLPLRTKSSQKTIEKLTDAIWLRNRFKNSLNSKFEINKASPLIWLRPDEIVTNVERTLMTDIVETVCRIDESTRYVQQNDKEMFVNESDDTS